MSRQDTQRLEKLIKEHDDVPILVHSDLFRANLFVEKSVNREQLLRNHLETVEQVIKPENIWIPTFNYQFPKTRFFDMKNAVSEIGPLTEYMRVRWARKRSFDPVFSFVSLEKIPIKEKIEERMIAFGHQTVFSTLVEKHGGVLFYGADFSSATIIHHIEFLSGGPLYRYDKIFDGHILDEEGNRRKIRFVYPVRPLDRQRFFLYYDWSRLIQELKEAGVISSIKKGNVNVAIYAKAYDLAQYWLEKLKDDPYYLLDKRTRSWVEPMVERLGRRFRIEDFEKSI